MDSLADIRLGVQRESQFNNPLLMKSHLGRPLTRCITLPPGDFAYGKKTLGKGTGVAEALIYQTAVMSTKKVKSQPRDFIALNKASTQAGLVTSEEQAQYRATHDVNTPPSTKENRLKLPKRLPPTMVFGKPTQRPVTPVFDLLENRYQTRWLKERRQAEINARISEAYNQKRTGSGKGYYETRASMLRRHSPPVDPLPPWQMRRFQKVPAQLETFRTDKAKTQAFEHHASDCTSRTGLFGHGIYEAAKS